MPTLGNNLDFSKYEARQIRIHQLGAAPSSPVTGQMYYNTADNTLYWWDGTQWQSAKGGATSTPPATTSSLGTIQLAGDLAGTATSPQIAAGVITDADVNSANKDGAVGLASMRTLGLGAQQAMPGNERLDQITAPTASVGLNNQKIVSLLDPTAAQDAATKNYVDNSVQGLDAKASVHAATAGSNIATLAGGAPNTLDGVTLALNDRILVKDQTTPAQNGIYTVTTLGTGANGTWARAADMDTWAEVPSSYVWVENGTVNADTGWVVTADTGGTLGTTSITWTKFSSANLGANAAQYYNNAATHGAGATITITQATHGLRASRGIHVQVQDNSTGNVEFPDVSVAANGDVTVTYAVAPAANSKLITLVG